MDSICTLGHRHTQRFCCTVGLRTLLALVKSVIIEIKYQLIEYVVSNTASVKIFHSCPEASDEEAGREPYV